MRYERNERLVAGIVLAAVLTLVVAGQANAWEWPWTNPFWWNPTLGDICGW